MANVTCLAVARDVVLKRAGWDAASQGLIGAPPLTVIAGKEAHATIFSALRMIGLGRDAAHLVAADDQGAIDPDALARALEDAGPAIVCAQAGNVNTGAFDPLEPIETCASRPARGCTSTARSACGRPPRPAPPPDARARARRQLGHRRPQVAQRPLRQRPGDRRATAPRTARAMTLERRLPRRRRAARQLRLHARGLAAGARLRALRRAALARPQRRRGAGRAPLRAGAPLRAPAAPTAAPRSSTTSCSTRCWSPRRRAPSRASRPTGRAGSAGRSGAAARRSGSRSRAGRRRTRMWSDLRGRSSPRSHLLDEPDALDPGEVCGVQTLPRFDRGGRRARRAGRPVRGGRRGSAQPHRLAPSASVPA